MGEDVGKRRRCRGYGCLEMSCQRSEQSLGWSEQLLQKSVAELEGVLLGAEKAEESRRMPRREAPGREWRCQMCVQWHQM